MVGLTSIPQWLEDLLGEKFFNPCLVHTHSKKNEKNTFCIDCSTSLCLHCLLLHQNHSLLQIRRYVYKDVIRLKDAQKLVDCSSVQSYTTNRAKVVFLNQRPMTRQFKGLGNICIICDRNLQYPYLFCSLSCRVQHMVSNNKVGCELNEERRVMSPESVLELTVSLRTSSYSSSTSSCVSTMNCRALNIASTEIVKKKRSSVLVSRTLHRPVNKSPAAEFCLAVNRRKGVPRRSPMF